jgi:hypothetical protein
MPEEREARPLDGEPAEDYSYDLAHEATTGAGVSAGPSSEREQSHGPYDGTQSDDDDGGDYGYDLAHDIPRQQPRNASGQR